MSEEKACPYCGEKILAVAIKCKHCGSDIKKSKKRSKVNPLFILILGTLGLTILIGIISNLVTTGTISGNGYTEADVANIEGSIRSEFSKRDGIRVEEVNMVIESPRRMTGFVKLRADYIGVMHKTCAATLGSNGQSIWECN